eukprot:gene9645-11826_t
MKNLSYLLIVYCFINPTLSLNNGLALTPPMGWNTWNYFGCNTSEINEKLIIDTAISMVKFGMKNVGYEYINLDDCWLAKTRDANGKLQPDPERFPSGILFLSNFIHSLGLKMGIYGDIGTQTCAGYPGSENYLLIDSQTYSEWGIDYVKMDGCNFPVQDMKDAYTQLSNYLNQTNRPMVYSCSWPTYAYVENVTISFSYVADICNLWREFDDISDSFTSWTSILDDMASATPSRNLYAGPGHWNDIDMLEVGNGGQTTTEYTSHFSLWAILAAPLIAGNDLRSMSQDTIDILTNQDVIDIDQDPLGQQGVRVYKNGDSEIWARNLVDDCIAVVLFNRGATTSTITLDLSLIPNVPTNSKYQLYDVWQHEKTGYITNTSDFQVQSHGVVMLKLSPV